MNAFKRLLAVAALLCASAPSHAGFCFFQAPTFSATQDSAGGVFTLDLTVGGIANNCHGAPGGSLASFELPYFADANATISDPAGWSHQIEQASGSDLGQALGAPTIRFTADDASHYVAYGSKLSGFTFASAYAAVLSPYHADYKTSGIFGDVAFSQLFVNPGLSPDSYLLIAGSPDALAALGNPSPVFLPPSAVPEPSTWLMLLAGFSIVALASRRARRAGASLPRQPMAMVLTF